MGYSTEFTGSVAVTPPLNAAETAYLQQFADTRRMRRNNGPYFVGGTGSWGQGRDADIVDYNKPPEGQPGLWCQWVPTADGTGIQWNETEKFYDATAWMQYLIDHFLKPGAAAKGHAGFEAFTFDHTVTGVIEAQGDDPDDAWELLVIDNEAVGGGIHGY